MKRMSVKLPIAVVLLASLVAGCGSQGSAGASPGGGNAPGGNGSGGNAGSVATGTKTLDMATNADPNFNPWSPTGFLESEPITELVFNGLTKWGLNYQPEPDLATDWSVSKDGLTWTFNLRKGVKWSDGQPFTSADVVYTFENIVLNKSLGANGASNYKDLQKVVATSDTQVQFILKKPWASLPTYLAYYTKILPKHIFNGQNPWKLTSFDKGQPIGTGPYKVTNYVSGQYVELQPNPDYYGSKPKIPKIIFHIIPDVNTQIAQLLSGNLEYVTIPDPALVAKLKSDPNIQVNAVMSNIWYWVALNLSEPRFQDVRVRQALEYAINRKAMIEGIMKGYGQEATGPIAPVQQHWYNGNVQQYSYDPQKAKELLKEAGYTPGPNGILQKNGQPFVINMPTGQYGVLTPASELVQQYWQAIGVKVNLNVMDWNSFIKQVVVNRKYDASLAWWSTPTDPDQYAYFASENAQTGYNIPGYKNPQLDKLFQDANAATSDAQRVQDYQQAQDIIAKQLPYLFLWWPKTIQATAKNLTIPNVGLVQAEDHVTDWTLN
jgi:peptide/nickel transport system substrate-binding protein